MRKSQAIITSIDRIGTKAVAVRYTFQFKDKTHSGVVHVVDSVVDFSVGEKKQVMFCEEDLSYNDLIL